MSGRLIVWSRLGMIAALTLSIVACIYLYKQLQQLNTVETQYQQANAQLDMISNSATSILRTIEGSLERSLPVTDNADLDHAAEACLQARVLLAKFQLRVSWQAELNTATQLLDEYYNKVLNYYHNRDHSQGWLSLALSEKQFNNQIMLLKQNVGRYYEPQVDEQNSRLLIAQWLVGGCVLVTLLTFRINYRHRPVDKTSNPLTPVLPSFVNFRTIPPEISLPKQIQAASEEVIATLAVPLILVDKTGKVCFINRAARQVLKRLPEYLDSKQLVDHQEIRLGGARCISYALSDGRWLLAYQ